MNANRFNPWEWGINILLAVCFLLILVLATGCASEAGVSRDEWKPMHAIYRNDVHVFRGVGRMKIELETDRTIDQYYCHNPRALLHCDGSTGLWYCRCLGNL